LDADGYLIGTKSEKSYNRGDRERLVVHTSKAFDARKPEAEEFIGPSFGFENMKGKHLMAEN
jgi:hypothetical protein